MLKAAQKGTEIHVFNIELLNFRNDCLSSFWYHSVHSNFSELLEVINEMGKGGDVYTHDSSVAGYHKKKFKVFLEMLKDQQKYNAIMN